MFSSSYFSSFHANSVNGWRVIVLMCNTLLRPSYTLLILPAIALLYVRNLLHKIAALNSPYTRLNTLLLQNLILWSQLALHNYISCFLLVVRWSRLSLLDEIIAFTLDFRWPQISIIVIFLVTRSSHFFESVLGVGVFVLSHLVFVDWLEFKKLLDLFIDYMLLL